MALETNGEGVRTFKKPRPRPWSEALVRRFDEQDKKIVSLGEEQSLQGLQLDNLTKNLNLHIVAFQNMQNEFKGHKQTGEDTKKGVDAIVTLLGSETEDGDGGWKGIGLLGRIRRNEGEVGRLTKLYNRWINYGAGFITCLLVVGGGAVAVIWWAFGDKLGHLLR
jgi:hypothetical protein